jgi:hypothetical protein
MTTWQCAIVTIGLAASAALASFTYGSNDVLFFESFLAYLNINGSEQLYRHGAPLIAFHPEITAQMVHPPAVIHLLRIVDSISSASGISFHVVFRLFTSLGHLATALTLMRMVPIRDSIWYAICPASIFIAGFHGNTDPIVVAFLSLAILSADKKGSPLTTGAFFAVACSTKVWPLMLAPAIVFYLPRWRQRAQFCMAFVAVVLALASPFIFQHPQALLSSVFGWRGYPGLWGLSLFFADYPAFGMHVVIVVVLTATYLLLRTGAALYTTIAVLMTIFFVIIPGFGVQYLAWLMPFIYIFPRPMWIPLWVSSSLFLGVIYTDWCGGLPWNFADSIRTGFSYSKLAIFTSMLTWVLLTTATTRHVWQLLRLRNAQATSTS